MTSIPVSASTKSFFMGTNAAAASAGTGVEQSFSEALTNQKSSEKSSKPEPYTSQAKVPSGKVKPERKIARSERREKASEDIVSQAEKAAEAVAEQLVQVTAEELGLTEEEVLDILNSLSMTPLDLLNGGNLQAVVLAASGENDNCSLVTDESLFSSYKNLNNALDEVIREVSQATGLSAEEVKEIFEKLSAAKENGDDLQQDIQATSFSTEDSVTATDGKSFVTSDEETKDIKRESDSVTEESGLDKAESKALAADKRTIDKHESKDFGSGEEPKPFFENKVMQLTDVATESVKGTTGYFDTETEMIMNQITDYMKSQVVDGVSEIDMQLHPENLGTLHVKLTSKEGVVTAHFTAENEVVKAALESQMIQLKETFKEQGVAVEAIEVMVESNRFHENQDSNGSMQGEDRQHERSRGRRIRLDNLNDEESLTEEEKLSVEMLRNSGNTVDYTA